MMRTIAGRLHVLAAAALVAAILFQAFLAGASLAGLGGSGDFGLHVEFGYTGVGLAALAVLLTAVAARVARVDIGICFGILLLYVVQTALPQFRTSIPSLAALHPANALVLFAIAAWYARRAWRHRTVGTSASRDATTTDQG